MALDFPASPTNGQVFSSGGVSWTFDGEKWKISSSSIEPVFISSSTPTGVAGQIYWDSDESTAYIYYDDGDTAQWVPLTSTAPVSFDASAIVSGTLPVARGGTGGTLPVENGGTGITVYGSAGQVLTSNGSSNNPSWQDASGGGSYDFVASGAIANGDTVIINTNGTVSVVGETGSSNPNAGTPAVFESANSNYTASTYDSYNNKVVIAYKDLANSNYGTAVVGTVSGTSISFGSPTVFESGEAEHISATFDSNSNKVVIAYMDYDDSQHGKAVVGTVSGTSISFGSPVTFESANTRYISATFDSNSNKVVIIYRDTGNSGYGTAIIGTVSGTSISFGSPVVFENSGTVGTNGVTFDSTNNKVVIAYNRNGGNGIVGTVSGTSISFGSSATFGAGAITSPSIAYDSSNQKVVVGYQDSNNSDYGTAVVGTVSGTSISFGTPVVFESASINCNQTAQTSYDANSGKIVIAYRDAGNSNQGTAIAGTVSGTSISFGTPLIFDDNSDFFSVTYDPDNAKVVIAYRNVGNSSYGTAVVFSPTSIVTNVTAVNYIGIAAEAIADTATGKINIIGGVNEGQTGLTAGQTYYVQGDGSLGLSPDTPSVVAGTAISATKLIVKG